MNIILNRDSVCMGDDMASHVKYLSITEEMRFLAFMEMIIADYLPGNIQGNDVVWCLSNGNQELLSYVSKTRRVMARWGNSDPSVAETARLSLCNLFYCNYYPSPLDRAKYLFMRCNGNMAQMRFSECYEEYSCYAIPASKEQEWQKEIINGFTRFGGSNAMH
ncbi:MAG: hypothetical protein LIP23_10290 [Planctomycetes bacterium]|nr:hypothetical protein [Planctomycetota bacterium]